MFKRLFTHVLLSPFLIPRVLGDGVDWIDPGYVKLYPSRTNSETASAAHAIVNRARSSAKNGPFTVTKGSKIKAPSGKEQDYFSWAPYYWPDCNWCKAQGQGEVREAGSDPDDASNSTDTSPGAQPSLDDPLNDAFLSDWAQDLLEYSVETINPIQTPAVQEERTRSQQASLDSAAVASSMPPTPRPLSDSIVQSIHGAHESVEADRGGRPTASSTCSPSPTTSMAPSATWTTCPYKAKDGKVNPDRNQLHGLSQLNSFAQSTIDNAIASVLESDPTAAKNAANFVDAFLLHPTTGMFPSIPWGQTIRGPAKRGSYMGVLDFRVMVKVANAIQILRVMNSPAWTNEMDGKLLKWANSYINWLETSELGMRPKKSANNHSTFYYAQMAALKILVGDQDGALKAVQDYFSGPFREQIVSSGEQPFECTRTKPFHYRAFNLQAMMAVAKIGDYLGLSMWTAQTRYRSTIKTAVDYLISLDPGHESSADAIPLAAVAQAVYGDDQRATYQRFLENGGRQDRSIHSKAYPYKVKTWWFYQQPNALKHTPAAMHRRNLPRDSEEDKLLYPYAAATQELLGGLPPFASAFNTVAVNEAGTSDVTHPKLIVDHSEMVLRLPAAAAGTEPARTESLTTPCSGAGYATVHNGDLRHLDDCTVPTQILIAEGASSDQIRPDSVAIGGPAILHPDRPAPFATTDAVELDEGIFVYWWQIRHLYQESSTKRSVWSRG